MIPYRKLWQRSQQRIKQWCLIALTSLAGCSSQPLIKPLTPASFDRSIVAIQQVTGHYKGGSILFETVVNISNDRLDIVFLSPMGQRTSTLQLHGKELLITKGQVVSKILPPELYLEALQLSFWPPAVLKAHIKGKKSRIEQNSNSRSVFFEGDLLIQIQYNSPSPWNGMVEYLDLNNNYRLTINSSLLSP